MQFASQAKMGPHLVVDSKSDELDDELDQETDSVHQIWLEIGIWLLLFTLQQEQHQSDHSLCQ